MSDSDDWENAADDILDDKPADNKKEDGKFADEDDVDSDDERKKKAEEEKKAKAAEPAQPKKQKASKKDYEAMYAERMGKGAQKAAALAKQGQKGEMLSRAAEEDITDQLFSPELDVESSGLKSEANYVKFAKQVGDILYEGQTPYNIPAFFNELTKGLATVPISSIDLKKVVDSITIVYNAKVAEEKKRDGGNKKQGKQKAKLAAGKATANSRNNNQGMIDDLVGGDDDYGDEYGDYGDYGDESGAAANQKVPE